MKITLDLPDNTLYVAISVLSETAEEMIIDSDVLLHDDLTDGKTIKLPREHHDD